jgi:hypothetical protein
MTFQSQEDANKARFQRYIQDAVDRHHVEAEIIKRLYEALEAADNPIIMVDDSEEENDVSTLWEVYEQVFNLDEAYLYTESGAYVFVVMGEEWETIADYNISLEVAIKPVNDWVAKNW